jgi:hypothetical protein
MSADDRDEGQRDQGLVESDTAFGMFSGETGGSGWMLRSRRGEIGPVDEDERPFPINAVIALVMLLGMGISVLWRLVRRR